MKRFLTLCLMALLLPVGFTACSSDEEENFNSEIVSSWELFRLSTAFSPDKIFKSGEMICRITPNDEIIISNKTHDNDVFLSSGTYHYNIIEGKQIVINETVFDYFINADGILVVSYFAPSDGFLYYLKKID